MNTLMPAQPGSRSSAGDVVDILARAAHVEREVAEHAVARARDLVGQRLGRGGQRLGVGHLEHRRDAAQHGGAAAGRQVLLVLEARLAEMHLAVDHAGQDVQAPAVDGLGRRGAREIADRRDPPVRDCRCRARPSPSWLTTVPPLRMTSNSWLISALRPKPFARPRQDRKAAAGARPCGSDPMAPLDMGAVTRHTCALSRRGVRTNGEGQQQDDGGGQGCDAGREPVAGSLDHAVRDAAVRPHQPEHFVPAFDRAFAEQHARDRGHRRRAAPSRRSPIPSRRWSAPAPRSIASPACSTISPAPTPTRRSRPSSATMAPRFATHGMRIYQNAKLFTRVDALSRSARQLGLDRGAGARAGALPSLASSRRRRARRQGQEAAGRDRRAARDAGTSSARTCWPTSRPSCWCWRRGRAGRAARRGARGGRATPPSAGHQGQARHHAVALQHRAVPAVLGRAAICASRRSSAWTTRGANGGKTDNRKIIAEILALRAERAQPARLSDSSPTTALEIHHGEDAGQRAQAADGGVGAGAAPRRARSATQLQKAVAGRGRQLRARGAGTGATTRRRCARPSSTSTRPRSSPTSRSTT